MLLNAIKHDTKLTGTCKGDAPFIKQMDGTMQGNRRRPTYAFRRNPRLTAIWKKTPTF